MKVDFWVFLKTTVYVSWNTDKKLPQGSPTWAFKLQVLFLKQQFLINIDGSCANIILFLMLA